MSCFITYSQEKWQNREYCPSNAKWNSQPKKSWALWHTTEGQHWLLLRQKWGLNAPEQGKDWGEEPRGEAAMRHWGTSAYPTQLQTHPPDKQPNNPSVLKTWSSEHPTFTTEALQCLSLSRIVQAGHSFMVHMSLWRNPDLGVLLGDMLSTNRRYQVKIEARMWKLRVCIIYPRLGDLIGWSMTHQLVHTSGPLQPSPIK